MSITIYYGVEIPANDFSHLIITTDEHDSLPLEVNVWTTDSSITENPQELLQEGEPVFIDEHGILILNPPPSQPARQSNVVIGVQVTTITDDESDPRAKMMQWSNFDLVDKSQIDDMLALICMDLQVPLQEPKYITVNSDFFVEEDDGEYYEE
jgi:hypothetical protein